MSRRLKSSRPINFSSTCPAGYDISSASWLSCVSGLIDPRNARGIDEADAAVSLRDLVFNDVREMSGSTPDVSLPNIGRSLRSVMRRWTSRIGVTFRPHGWPSRPLRGLPWNDSLGTIRQWTDRSFDGKTGRRSSPPSTGNFPGLVFGCIKTDFYGSTVVGKRLTRSIRSAFRCTSPNWTIQKRLSNDYVMFHISGNLFY
jgi:hypothetical protein